jgi:hypothetical protein
MRSNIVRCLEDFSDFEYIWSSTLNDTVADTPFFSSESHSPISSELEEVGSSGSLLVDCNQSSQTPTISNRTVMTIIIEYE